MRRSASWQRGRGSCQRTRGNAELPLLRLQRVVCSDSRVTTNVYEVGGTSSHGQRCGDAGCAWPRRVDAALALALARVALSEKSTREYPLRGSRRVLPRAHLRSTAPADCALHLSSSRRPSRVSRPNKLPLRHDQSDTVYTAESPSVPSFTHPSCKASVHPLRLCASLHFASVSLSCDPRCNVRPVLLTASPLRCAVRPSLRAPKFDPTEIKISQHRRSTCNAAVSHILQPLSVSRCLDGRPLTLHRPPPFVAVRSTSRCFQSICAPSVVRLRVRRPWLPRWVRSVCPPRRSQMTSPRPPCPSRASASPSNSSCRTELPRYAQRTTHLALT